MGRAGWKHTSRRAATPAEFAALALFGLSSEASATTVLDTRGTCVPYSNGCGPYYAIYNVNPSQSVAVSFTLGAAATITSVEAYIFQTGLITGTSVTLGIMTNNASNVPSGSFISGGSSTVTPGTGPADLTSLNWSLAAGTYWLAAIANSPGSLAWESVLFPPLTPWALGNDTGSAWNNAGTQTEPIALIQTGTPVVPLPGALPLFATGLGALGLLGWRRKKKPPDPISI
jgi:hypothetical protein